MAAALDVVNRQLSGDIRGFRIARGEDSGVEGQESHGSLWWTSPEASSSDEEKSVQVSLMRERGGVAHLVDAGDGLSAGIGSAGSVETRRKHRDDAFWK